MRILNFTVHVDEIYTDDGCAYGKRMFSLHCCGHLVVEEVVHLYDPSDYELEAWAADKLKSLFEQQKKDQ